MKIKPNKRLGQNFLKDKGVVKKILKAADLKPNDTILEIGPGFGILTKELIKTVKKVIAIEKDKRLADSLREDLKEYNNVKIVNEDILKNNYKLPTINYKLVANLPFNIASAVIRKLLEEKNKPKEMILMVQKEVGQKITAKPPRMSILSVSVQVYAEAKILFYVPKEYFQPKPKVDATVIKITPWGKPGLLQKELFFKIVRGGFSSPRKQITNNLSKELNTDKENTINWLRQNNINPNQRAETLTVEDWKNLTKSYELFTNN